MGITVTRGLAEMKVLDQRILKGIEEARLIGIYQDMKDQVIGLGMKKDDFEKACKSQYQAVTDLVERRTKIKSAIILSNATTKVKIADKEFTVAEVIERKSSIKHEENLLTQMKHQLAVCRQQVENSKVQVMAQVERLLTTSLGADKKADKETWDKVAQPIIDAQLVQMLDPLTLEVKIQVLEKKIQDFKMEADFTLSESNSKTTINVE